MNGERPLQNHGSSNCSNQLRINDEFAQLGGVYYTPPLDSPRSPIAVYPLSSTDDAPCRSHGLSSLLALNRKSILRLRQTATSTVGSIQKNTKGEELLACCLWLHARLYLLKEP